MEIKLKSNIGQSMVNIRGGNLQLEKPVSREWAQFEIPAPRYGIFIIQISYLGPKEEITLQNMQKSYVILRYNTSSSKSIICQDRSKNIIYGDGLCPDIRGGILSKVGVYHFLFQARGKNFK